MVAAVVDGSGTPIFVGWSQAARTRSRTSTASTTVVLPDCDARLPERDVYYFAYVQRNGDLQTVGPPLSLQEALVGLGFSGAANSLEQSFTYDNMGIIMTQEDFSIFGLGVRWKCKPTHDERRRA